MISRQSSNHRLGTTINRPSVLYIICCFSDVLPIESAGADGSDVGSCRHSEDAMGGWKKEG